MTADRPRLAAAAEAVPEWIVNDIGELGVRVNGRCWFMYKGGSLEYETGLHDDGDPVLVRNIGKREFGEVQHTDAWVRNGRSEDRYDVELAYHPGLSDGPPDDPRYQWMPLPTAALAPHVPERDELVAGLRLLGRQWRSGAALSERLSADDPGVIACGAQLSECAEQVTALLARHAPEHPDV